MLKEAKPHPGDDQIYNIVIKIWPHTNRAIGAPHLYSDFFCALYYFILSILKLCLVSLLFISTKKFTLYLQTRKNPKNTKAVFIYGLQYINRLQVCFVFVIWRNHFLKIRHCPSIIEIFFFFSTISNSILEKF